MPLMQSTTPMLVQGALTPGGAAFTGLMFLRGDQFGIDSCCGNGGDCVAISFVDGIYQNAHMMGAGLCPDDFPALTGITLQPNESGGIFEAGYRWGQPSDLLATMPEAGCCYTAELTIPDQSTMEWASIPGVSAPLNDTKEKLIDAEVALAALIDSYDELKIAYDGQAEAIAMTNSYLARAEAAEAQSATLSDLLAAAELRIVELSKTPDAVVDAEAAKTVQEALVEMGPLELVPYGEILDCEEGSAADCCEELRENPVMPNWVSAN